MKLANKQNREQIANTLAKIQKQVNEAYSVLGFFKQNPSEFIDQMKQKYLIKMNIEEEFIKQQIDNRLQAKQNKDYETADKIRAELEEKGIILNDTKDGTVWDIKDLY